MGLGRASTRQLGQPPVGGVWYCHVTAAARIVPRPFLGISVSDFRKFTHKNFRECVVSHTLFECVGNATRREFFRSIQNASPTAATERRRCI